MTYVCAPFRVFRGIRQGCALSGMLYSLAIEPLLRKFRAELKGVNIPYCENVFKLSAYADDIVILGKIDTPWRNVLHLSENARPEWGALYKSPLSKKIGDLQWRVLHGIIAVNAFVSIMNCEVNQ